LIFVFTRTLLELKLNIFWKTRGEGRGWGHLLYQVVEMLGFYNLHFGALYIDMQANHVMQVRVGKPQHTATHFNTL